MAKKGRQASKKKTAVPEDDEKQNETILEEVLSISGKSNENLDGSTPAKQKRAANKANEVSSIEPKRTAKRSSSPASLPSKRKKAADKEDGKLSNTVNDKVPSSSIRGDPIPNFPDGWRRQVVVRKSGKSAGLIDIYFYSPDGAKLRSRPEVTAYLNRNKTSLTLDDFDFNRGTKASNSGVKKKAVAGNKVPEKKGKTAKKVQPEKSSEKVSSKKVKSRQGSDPEGSPPAPDSEEKADTEVKTNKALPFEKKPVDTNKAPKEKIISSKTEMLVFNKPPRRNQRRSPKLLKSSKKMKEISSNQPKRIQMPHKFADAGEPVPNLPGWRKKIVVRKSGIKIGQEDIYFYSPEGIKLRSIPEVRAYIQKKKANLSEEDFDFHRKTKNHKKKKSKTGKSKIASKSLSAKVPQEKNDGKFKKGMKGKKKQINFLHFRNF